MRKLTLDDILDTRAYEREREVLRRHIIDLKRRRRIALGDFMSMVFENTETMRWQVQEMARVEHMTSDEQIEHEISTYNELIPDPNELSATLFIELDDEWALREWLPRLVGIHERVLFRLADGSEVRAIAPDADRLTRDDVTAAVHFLRFRFTDHQIASFRSDAVRIAIDHPNYSVEVVLTPEQRHELSEDFR